MLLGLAVPSFLDTMRNNRLVAQNNEFIGALNFARSEALKRSDFVSVCASADQAHLLGEPRLDHRLDRVRRPQFER